MHRTDGWGSKWGCFFLKRDNEEKDKQKRKGKEGSKGLRRWGQLKSWYMIHWNIVSG